jgi:hypothetical protein
MHTVNRDDMMYEVYSGYEGSTNSGIGNCKSEVKSHAIKCRKFQYSIFGSAISM